MLLSGGSVVDEGIVAEGEDPVLPLVLAPHFKFLSLALSPVLLFSLSPRLVLFPRSLPPSLPPSLALLCGMLNMIVHSMFCLL